MPPWSAINPRAIAAQLPILWSYKYDAASDTFTGRISGENIAHIFGRNLRGLPMRDVYPSKDYARLFARSRRVTCEPALFHGQGLVFHHLERYGQGERIMMPLGEDGETGDGILGATVYETRIGDPGSSESEIESWFTL
jgi:hypothetical protein